MRGHFECDCFGFEPMRGHGPLGHHFGRQHGPFGRHGPFGPHYGPRHHGRHCHGHHHGHRGHGMGPGFGPFPPPPGFGSCERPKRCSERQGDSADETDRPEGFGHGPCGRGPWGHGPFSRRGHGPWGHGPWGRGCRRGEEVGSPECGRKNKEKRGCGCKNKKDQGTQAVLIERVLVDNDVRCNSV